MFFGTTFLGIKYTALPTAAFSKDETYLKFGNGLYSDVYGTKEIDSNMTNIVPENWDWDTLIKADYSDGQINAGNSEWTLQTVSELVIKKRIKGTFDWTTVDVREINQTEDFNFQGIDRYSKANTTYEYAIVPYLNHNPGNYTIVEIDSDFDAVFILEKEKTFKTFITNAFVDTTRNIPGSYNVPMESKYAVFFSSGNMNYDSGSVDGKFYEIDEACRIMNDPGYLYKKSLMDFLSDRKPKILKHPDGRIWLIQITPNPTDTADGRYDLRTIHFDWVEVGDVNSIEHLYSAGLIDLAQEWWE